MRLVLPSLRRSTRLLAGASAAAGVAALALVAVPAQAAENSWTVPRQATITIDGHGYGHGHGMSQYGAEGAGRQGVGYRRIVEFYYPNTRWGTARGPVRVLISADTSDDLLVVARSGLQVRGTGGGGFTTLPDNGASRWRISSWGDGTNHVGYLTNTWHHYAALRGQGEFGAGGEPITLITPSGSTQYRGRLRAAAPSSGSAARDTVNILPLDSYLRGVVPLEMPALWTPAAVRSQSVAARTYAAYERAHPRAGHYQLCDTASCQVYGGYSAEHSASDAAIDATRQQVLLSGGDPAFTQFSSSSGGWTAAGSFAYLPAKRDPYDGWSGNPVHSWSTSVTDARLESQWPALGNLTSMRTTRDGHGDWGGRVRTVTLKGSQGRVQVSGDTFRSVLGLRSTWLTFRVARR
ncbi:MAG TPA: SpoIID/LytB domain-containing protein [Micromonosporaceae bacterium]|nr:SpoIID/LytB domain-containing protein [Micromonosporaceae bacterium]